MGWGKSEAVVDSWRGKEETKGRDRRGKEEEAVSR